MSDALTWGIAAGFAAEEGIKFLYSQMAELLKRARERKARPDSGSAATASDGEVLVASPPATAFAQAPSELRLPVASIVNNEQVLDALLWQVKAFLVTTQAGRSPDEKSWQAVRDMRALVESISGHNLTFTGEPKEVRPIIRLDAVINEIGEKGRVIVVDVKSGNQKDADLDLDVGRIDGEFTAYRET